MTKTIWFGRCSTSGATTRQQARRPTGAERARPTAPHRRLCGDLIRGGRALLKLIDTEEGRTAAELVRRA